MERRIGATAFLLCLLSTVSACTHPGYGSGPKGETSQRNVSGVVGEGCDDKIRSMQAIVDKQHEIIDKLKFELDKCKGEKNGKKP